MPVVPPDEPVAARGARGGRRVDVDRAVAAELVRVGEEALELIRADELHARVDQALEQRVGAERTPRDGRAPAARAAGRRQAADDVVRPGLESQPRLAAAADLDPAGERLPVAEHEREANGAPGERRAARRRRRGREAQLALDAKRRRDPRLVGPLRDQAADRHVGRAQAAVRQRVPARAVEQRRQLLRPCRRPGTRPRRSRSCSSRSARSGRRRAAPGGAAAGTGAPAPGAGWRRRRAGAASRRSPTRGSARAAARAPTASREPLARRAPAR